jgi:acetolactate synthase regulatory subunit
MRTFAADMKVRDRPDLTEQHQGCVRINGFQHCQINARHPVQHAFQVESEFIGIDASPVWSPPSSPRSSSAMPFI